jgi:hypothetical protein
VVVGTGTARVGRDAEAATWLAKARIGDGRGVQEARELLTAAVSAQPKWRDDAAAVRLRRRTAQRIAARRGGLAGLWFRLLHGF